MEILMTQYNTPTAPIVVDARFAGGYIVVEPSTSDLSSEPLVDLRMQIGITPLFRSEAVALGEALIAQGKGEQAAEAEDEKFIGCSPAEEPICPGCGIVHAERETLTLKVTPSDVDKVGVLLTMMGLRDNGEGAEQLADRLARAQALAEGATEESVDRAVATIRGEWAVEWLTVKLAHSLGL